MGEQEKVWLFWGGVAALLFLMRPVRRERGRIVREDTRYFESMKEANAWVNQQAAKRRRRRKARR